MMMPSLHNVTIEYVLKKSPDARQLMLCTTKDISRVNYDNYLNAGFPVPSIDSHGYQFLKKINFDHDGYPSDCSYFDRARDTDAWSLWNDGEFDWKPLELEDGSFDDENGHDISGGYGADKYTFIAEFPPHSWNNPSI